ncbi:PIF1-like helicase domain-containing protein [Hirsutella rhossiliensis]|uniref:ATP-dependent DNA helicase n=1 Tax=Hirsutella rhossiliensis TaxID=111463 RepID=A0A9P8MSU0_9HYPO|nr:PIF1-like helicase domain-containing protein [Hirsutella rhossiliensis]KAH0960427.1 PIF1-like helicase domain-containing protein [Hirsutella rhossiliensis]
MVNRWNKAIAVGLRHNHDISFIATQRKTMALVFYVTNYATKVEDPVWKRVVAAADLLPPRAGDEMADDAEVRGGEGGGDDGKQNRTRQFLMKVANRVFTERPLSQVEVIADLLGYPTELTNNEARRLGGPARERLGSGSRWVQVLRRPGKQAMVCLDGYLSKDFDEDDEGRATEERLCSILRYSCPLVPRISCYVDNVQLLRRSAEDAKRDAKQWAASSGDRDATAVHPDEDGTGEAGVEPGSVYQADSTGNTMRLIDVVRSSIGANQITAGSPELTAMMQELSRFQQLALSSSSEFQAAILSERGPRRINIPGGHSPEPEYRRRVSVLTGFGDDDIQMTAADLEETVEEASAGMEIRLGTSTSFIEAGKALVARFTLNKKEKGNVRQLCQFVGGEGGTGKSRVIEALVELFASKDQSNRLIITATSGTAAARINGITIHSACGFSKDLAAVANTGKDLDGVRMPNQAERFVHGQSRMDWQEKDVLVVDEVSMLGARTLHAVNEQLCRLRGSHRDFGGIPIVLFCGDFHQFRPVQERSILLPSTVVSWDMDNSFKAEQRHQHDKAHALWKRFTAVVMLDEQVRAADDPELQRLLKRIRLGVQDRTDLDLLNTRCYQEGRQIPWASGITVVTPLNRNRWNLNMEASLAFQIQHRSTLRIFISGHKWKEGLPTEEEAIMILNQGDDSAIPVPAVFMFVPGMPVVVNHNTHQGLKLVNGASYAALEVILDKSYPGHRISADMTIHFGPPAGIMLESETTKDVQFNDVSRKGLPCTAAFACTDYKVQGRTLERVALELRGTRTSNIEDAPCPRSATRTALRERDLVGNKVPDEMTDAEARLGRLSDKTVREALEWLDVDSLDPAGLHVKLS